MSTTTNSGMGSIHGSVIEFSKDLQEQDAPPPLPTGTYPAEVIAATARTSQTTGNVYAGVQFKIDANAYPADFIEGDPDGMVLTYNRLILEDTGRSRWRIRRFCEAIGAPLGTRVDLTDWIGCRASLEITHDEYEGEMRAQIAKVLPA